MSRVSILPVGQYRPDLLDKAVEEHFLLLGLEGLVKPGDKVVLKPNLLMRRTPQEATTTHPEVVAAVVRALKRRGVTDLILADSPGGLYTEGILKAVYKTTGMAAMAEREGVALNFSEEWTCVPAQGARRARDFNLIGPVARADVVINLCKLKTHCMTGMSGAVKNLFGCIPGLQKPELHYRYKKPEEFCDLLVDLCETIRPAFTLVDAVEAMEGDGPSGGTPARRGLLLCAKNPYDLDVVLAKLIGMPQQQARTVQASVERGLASPFEQITLCGQPQLLEQAKPLKGPSARQVDFNAALPGWLRPLADRLTERWVVPRPVIRRKDCVGCGRCAESCPARTIHLVEKKAKICYHNCIKCYCCHEMCPVKAIDLKALSRIGRRGEADER